MYRTPVIIGEISPDRAKTPLLCVIVRFALKGLIFDNDQQPIHYPDYYMATCQNQPK